MPRRAAMIESIMSKQKICMLLIPLLREASILTSNFGPFSVGSMVNSPPVHTALPTVLQIARSPPRPVPTVHGSPPANGDEVEHALRHTRFVSFQAAQLV